MKIVYLPHHEFLKKIEEYERMSKYTNSVGVYNGVMELKFYNQNGGIIYRPRALTKLEKALR